MKHISERVKHTLKSSVLSRRHAICESSSSPSPELHALRLEDIRVDVKITEKSNEESNESPAKDLTLPLEFVDINNKSMIYDIKSPGTSSVSNRKFKLKSKSNLLIQGRSLYIFGPDNKFRILLKTIMDHPYFENFIYSLITLNSLLLAIDEPVLVEEYQNNTISQLTTIISTIFIAEAVMKIIVLGFVIGKGTYLRDPWNILDFIIVFFSVLNWILDSFSNINVTFLRGFRALRALRPLRMVSKNEGLKIVVDSLLKSIPSLFNVMLICLLFLLVFGILAVQLFQGSMGYCSDASIDRKNNCVGDFVNNQGSVSQRQWVVAFNNFDNILFSMVTFFEIATLENWPQVLFATMDSQGEDMGPKKDARQYAAILFVVFIFITTFFIMNLFISVIVDKFNEEIRKKEGSHNFTDEQKEWVKMQGIMLHVTLKIRPTPPKNKCRRCFYKVVVNNKFEYFIIFVIVLNTLFLCMDYNDQPATYAQVLDNANIVFLGVFGCEAVMKLIAHGPKFYFMENWNKFDFVIVVISVIAQQNSLFTFKITVLRIIRVARLLRMIKTSKGLRHLLKALWLSLGNIINVSLILFLVFFTFSVAGMDLFGQITDGNFINSQAHFKTFYITLITLFRCSTGENWNGIMHDCYDQVGPIAVFYWLAFELVTHYIFLNVFIAVIYENFSNVKASENETEVLSLKRKDIKAFVKTWSLFCPNGEHYMKTSNFPAFLAELPPPLGYGGINIHTQKMNKIMYCLNIKSHLREGEGKVYFPEVMWAVFHSIVGNNDEKVHKCEQVLNIMKLLKRKYKGLPKNLTPDILCGNRFGNKEMTVSKYLCAMSIYKTWKSTKELRKAYRERMAKSMLDKASESAQQVEEISYVRDNEDNKLVVEDDMVEADMVEEEEEEDIEEEEGEVGEECGEENTQRERKEGVEDIVVTLGEEKAKRGLEFGRGGKRKEFDYEDIQENPQV